MNPTRKRENYYDILERLGIPHQISGETVQGGSNQALDSILNLWLCVKNDRKLSFVITIDLVQIFNINPCLYEYIVLILHQKQITIIIISIKSNIKRYYKLI